MKRYEEDDVMTCYFVVDDRGDCKTIRGWTDDKEYAKLYMDFHLNQMSNNLLLHRNKYLLLHSQHKLFRH